MELETRTEAAPPPEMPDDYIVLLDNSRSIRGEQQVILREAVKVLADIALPGDRVAVVTFDQEARLLLVRDIDDDDDRREVREAVDGGVDFSGNHSDMTAAFEVLLEQRDTVFRLNRATQNVIILSDGKVEPPSRAPGEALDRLIDIASRDLSFCTYFPIGLGNTAIHDPIARGRPDTGETLMRDVLTARGGRFFHADSFDRVHSAILSIFVTTKGLDACSDETGRFAADESIERVVVVVPKRGESGEVLAETRAIRIEAPGDREITATSGPAPLGDEAPTRILWTSSYQYFDIIRIEHPAPGHWTVEVPEAARAGLMLLNHSATRVMHDDLASFYVNETRPFAVWVFDSRSGRSFERPLDVTMQIREGDDESGMLTTRLARVGDRYVTSSTDLVALGLVPGRSSSYRFRLTGQEEHFFLRSTPWSALSVLEPLVVVGGSERGLAVDHYVLTLLQPTSTIELTATIERARPDFEQHFAAEAPALSVEVFRTNPETNEVESVGTHPLDAQQSGDVIAYRAALDLEPGAYAAVLTASGTDAEGRPVTLRLLPTSMTVTDYGPITGAGALALLLIIVVAVTRRVRLRLRVKLQIERLGEKTPGKWVFEDDDDFPMVRTGSIEVPAHAPARDILEGVPAFRIDKSFKLFCVGRATYRLTALGAPVDIETMDEKETLERGKSRTIPSQCTFECRGGGKKFTIEVSAR